MILACPNVFVADLAIYQSIIGNIPIGNVNIFDVLLEERAPTTSLLLDELNDILLDEMGLQLLDETL